MGIGISEIISGIFKPVADYFGRKQEIKAQEHENDIAVLKAQGERQADLIKTGLAADASWEMVFAQQAASSWKDEYTLLVVSIPLIMAFIPGLDKYVMAGFDAFSKCPMWYQLMVQTLFYASWGIRLWRRNQSDTP